jgi:putative ABC transport system permease protein
MALRPIVSAMLRNKTGLILIALQIALTLAVVVNACFIIVQRIEQINRPSGIDSDNIFFVQSYGFSPQYDQLDTVRRDVDLLRSLPGVVAASYTSGVPMSDSGSASTFRATPGKSGSEAHFNTYGVDEQSVVSFGVKLLAGRAFRADEVALEHGADFVPSVILTTDAAKALYGNEPAVGKQIFDNLGQAATVVGVIDNMLGAWPHAPNITQVMFMPVIEKTPTARYVVRTEPGRRAEAMRDIELKMAQANPTRTINYVHPHSFFSESSYKSDSRMVTFLGVLVGLMILVTALGILGLASFQVRVRTKQIGTRRAVGARRIDIIRHFMLENLILTATGLVLGTLLAFAFGQYLSAQYHLPRLDPMYVVWGIAALIVLGQIAAFSPARRAAAVPPAIATRTV